METNRTLSEFVALSKCLAICSERHENEACSVVTLRTELATSILSRMRLLLNTMEAPMNFEEGIRQDVEACNKAKAIKVTTEDLRAHEAGEDPWEQDTNCPSYLVQAPRYKMVDGARVLTTDQELDAERQLVAKRLEDVILAKLHDLDPDDSPSLMIDVQTNGTVQAYIIPDTVSNVEPPRLNVFQFQVELNASNS